MRGSVLAAGWMLAVMVAVTPAVIEVSVADASPGTQTSGLADPNEALVIDPSEGAKTGPTIDLAAGSRVFVIESMPKPTVLRRVTIGDLARDASCQDDPQVGLTVVQYATSNDPVTGTPVADAIESRPLGSSLQRVTWLLNPTQLEEGATYAFVVRSVGGECERAQQRSWAHNAPIVDGGDRACATVSDADNVLRVWHAQGIADDSECGAWAWIGGFDAAMPDGWREARRDENGEWAMSSTPCASGTEPEVFQVDTVVCRFSQFSARGESGDADGWYYGLPWTGPGLDGSPRDLYLRLEPDRHPVVHTGAATDVATTSAHLSGTVDASDSPTSYWFEWGRTTDYGKRAPVPAGSLAGDEAEPVAVAVTGLRPGTTYHFRLRAAHGDGEPVDGEDRTLSTDSVAPVSVTAPDLSGHLEVGQQLTASRGVWTGDPPLSFRYQWVRCAQTGDACAPIDSATYQAYRLAAADLDKRIRVRVDASSGDAVTSATSPLSASVRTPTPTVIAPPSIDGEATVGAALSVRLGRWEPSAFSIAHEVQWRRCDAGGAGCTEIQGATGRSYTLTTSDAGSTLRARVVASTSGGSAEATSKPSLVVAPGTLANTSQPTLSLHPSTSGSVLTADPGDWQAVGELAFRYDWQRCEGEGAVCRSVSGEGATYSLTAADVGSRLRVRVTASSAEGSSSALSLSTDVISAAAPTVVAAAVIEAPRSGELVSSEEAIWSGVAPLQLTRQWRRCAGDGTGCVDILGATAAAYRARDDDIGARLRLAVTAVNAFGTDTSVSAASPVVTAAPDAEGPQQVGGPAGRIVGDVVVGAPLTVEPGLWVGVGPLAFAYEWERCDLADATCELLDDEAGASYTPTNDDVGRILRATVTVTDSVGESDLILESAMTAHRPGDPAPVSMPAVTGSATEGGALVASPGEWTGGEGPLEYTYRWQACDSDGTSCSDIEAADAVQYEPTIDDVGSAIRVAITADDGQSRTTAFSSATDTVGGLDPENTAPPTVSGLARSGSTLTSDNGAWKNMATLSFSRQWSRCDAAGDCDEISGATEPTYQPTVVDVGAALIVEVTAENASEATTVSSEPTDVIEAAGAPTLEEAPVITGTALEGQMLTATTGTWEGSSPLTYHFQWQACDGDGTGCIDITGAEDATYTASADDAGWVLRAVVSATSSNGTSHAPSAVTETVAPLERSEEPLQNATAPRIVGHARVGAELTAEPGIWSGGDDIAFRYQWRRCEARQGCISVEGATEPVYVPDESDIGASFRVSVTATNGSQTRALLSEPTPSVGDPADAPVNDSEPWIYGTAIEHSVLEGGPGEWHGGGELSYMYAWERCDAEGDNCESIDGAEHDTYALTAADIGSLVRLRVTASNDAGETIALSSTSELVAPGEPPTADESDPPTVWGYPNDGQLLSAWAGSWMGEPSTYAYQWKRCDEEGTGCVEIEGATAEEYTVLGADVGSTLRIAVTGANPSGSATVESAPTEVITTQAPENMYEPEALGERSVGAQLEAWPGEWSGSGPIAFTYQWQRCEPSGDECDDIDGATSEHYTVETDDSSSDLRVLVTASNGHGSLTLASPRTEAPAPRPENVSAPTIAGTPTAGQSLTGSPGTWSSADIEISHHWQRCDESERCEDIPGSDYWWWGWTYPLTSADAGYRLRLAVRATADGAESDWAYSAPSSIVQVTGAPAAPRYQTNPTLARTARNGHAIHVDRGAWTGAQPIEFSFEWRRCNSSATQCAAIATTQAPDYTPRGADVGQRLQAKVVARNAYGSSSSFTLSTDPVEDAAPETVPEPTITGEASAGSPLEWSLGNWQPMGTVESRWQRCSVAEDDCADIEGADGSFYRPTHADLGYQLRVRVTDRNSLGEAEAHSARTTPIAPATLPRNEEAPVVTGSPRAGETLFTSAGDWSGTPDLEFEYAWSRCDGGGACAEIAGATSADYTARRADVGYQLVATVTAANGGGATSVVSEASAQVEPPPPLANLFAPSIGWWEQAVYGENFEASAGSWAGEPDIVVQWQRCDPLSVDPDTGDMNCIDIPDATSMDHGYTPTAADIGFHLRAKETATTPSEARIEYSDLTAGPVRVGDRGYTSFDISGAAITGQTIEAESEYRTAAGLPTSTDYVFVRLEDDGSETTLQSGGDSSYTLSDDDQGHVVEVVATTSIMRADEAAVIGTDEERRTTDVVEPGPENVQVPTLEGQPVVGAELTASEGHWQGGGQLRFSYRWQRCDEHGDSCADIAGATASSRVVEAADAESTLRVRVTAANGSVHAVATSDATAVIDAAVSPVNTSPPAIDGPAVERSLLTAEPGDWTGSEPIQHAYQWRACAPGRSDCEDIDGATEPTFRPTADETDGTLEVSVTATNAAGATTAVSARTETVEPGPAPENTTPPNLAILGRPSVDATLTTDGGEWQHINHDELRYQWQRCDTQGGACEEIADAYGPDYTVTDADVGARLQVDVAAHTSGGDASSTSELSPTIEPAAVAAVSKMVYVTGVDEIDPRSDLMLSNLDGGSPTHLARCDELPNATTDNCELHRPKISPNGQMIAVEVHTGSGPDATETIVVLNHDGSDARAVVSGQEPAWSADGTKLLFTDDTSGSEHIASITLSGRSGRDARTLTSGEGSERSADASPDGARLTFIGDSGGGPRLIVSRPGGEHARPIELPSVVGQPRHPQFTADGSAILFEGLVPGIAIGSVGPRRVWKVRTDGSGLRPITADDDGVTTESPAATDDDKIIVTRRTADLIGSYPSGRAWSFGAIRTVVIDPNDPDDDHTLQGAVADASAHRAKIANQTDEELARKLRRQLGLDDLESRLNGVSRTLADDALAKAPTTALRRLLPALKVGGVLAKVVFYFTDAESLGCDEGDVGRWHRSINGRIADHLDRVAGISHGPHPVTWRRGKKLEEAIIKTLRNTNAREAAVSSECKFIPAVAADTLHESLQLVRDANSFLVTIWRRDTYAEVMKHSKRRKLTGLRTCAHPGPRPDGFHSVYWAVPARSQDDDDLVRYVGRSKDLRTRCRGHQKERPFISQNLETLNLPRLTETEVRATEEALIAHFGPRREFHNTKPGQRGQLSLNGRHEIRPGRYTNYCVELLRGQYILKYTASTDYGRLASAGFTRRVSCPGTGAARP